MPSLTHIEDAYPAVAESGHFNPRMEDVEYGALDGLLGYAVRRAQLRVYEDFVRSLQAWNITPPRFSAMTVIAHNPDLKLTELAGILGVARSGAVLLVDTLEAMGMVERLPSPVDRRAFRLALTDKGRSRCGTSPRSWSPTMRGSRPICRPTSGARCWNCSTSWRPARPDGWRIPAPAGPGAARATADLSACPRRSPSARDPSRAGRANRSIRAACRSPARSRTESPGVRRAHRSAGC